MKTVFLRIFGYRGPLLCRISKPLPTPGEIVHACHHQPGPRRGSWCLLELCLCCDSICSLQPAVCSAQTLQLDPKASRRTLTAASVPHLPGRRNLLALTGAGPRIASPFAVSESLLLCRSESLLRWHRAALARRPSRGW